MRLKPLFYFFYRVLFLLSSESRSFNNSSSIISTSKEVGIDESIAYLNFSENNSFILTESLLEDNVGCAVINPNFIDNLSQYESLLEEYSEYSCKERKSNETLLLRKMPDEILDSIAEKKMELKIPCNYDPLSENMHPVYVNNRFSLQLILNEDLLRLRLNYWIHYYQSCLPKDYKEITLSLKGNDAIIPDCKSLEIVKKLLPALYATILDKYLTTKKINIPELELDLRHLVKIQTNKLSKDYKKGTLIQCQIDKIDYILRGRKGLKFLLHNFAIQAINKLLLPEISLQSCDSSSSTTTNFFNESSKPVPTCLKTTFALNVHEKLQDFVNNRVLEQSHLLHHCGQNDYELFKLGIHLEENKEINKTLNCLFDDMTYSIPSNRISVFIRKLVDHDRNDYLLNCTSTLLSDKTSEQSSASTENYKRFKRSNFNNKNITYKSQLNKIKPCQNHEVVQKALWDTITNIIQMNSVDTESSCLELTKKIFETAAKAEFKANWSLSTSKAQCSLAPKRIANPTYSNLMVAYNKVLRKWIIQHSASCVEHNPNDLPISFAFRVGEVFCFKLTLPLVEHHFKLMLKQSEILGSIIKDHPKFDFVLKEQDAKLNTTFKDLLEEESTEGSLARQYLAEKNPTLLQKIPLELFFYFSPLQNIIAIENFLTSPVIIHSSSATQKACYNYFLGTMFFKKVENLFKNSLDFDNNNEFSLKNIKDFSKKSKEYFEKHKIFLNKFGTPNEYLYQLNYYEKQLTPKKIKRDITNQVSFFQECTCPAVSTEKSNLYTDSSTSTSKSGVDKGFSCNIPLEKYLNFVTSTDNMKNMAFKNSIIFALNCEEKNALNQILLAFPEVEEHIDGELKFQNKFHVQCSNLPGFKSMIIKKIIETTERDECKREKIHKSLTPSLLN